jgi:hypothetical protein
MYSVATLSANEFARLRPILETSRFKPYRFLKQVGHRELADFWYAALAEAGHSQSVAVCLRDGVVVGLASIGELEWESRVLDRRIYGIHHLAAAEADTADQTVLGLLLEHILTTAADQGAETVHCKRFTDDTLACQALERKGFLLVDTQLVYGFAMKDLENKGSQGDQRTGDRLLRLAAASDMEELAELARASFQHHFGRFHSDDRLSSESASQVYEQWMRSSLSGYADWTVVAEVAGRLAACSIWRKPTAREAALSTRIGHYSIGAVHPDFQRRGLFIEVTEYGLALFRGIADCVVGPTHVNNYGVQRGYARMGWRIVDAHHTFHKWLS